jgi:HK97 family phage prohead protease
VEETRTLTFRDAEVRAAGSGERQRFTFHGYAATFGTRSNVLREAGVNRGRPFVETVKAGAAKETIAKDDIRFVLNHELRQLLGRTSSGTLRLGEDTNGIEVRADLPNTSYARDYAELVQRGDAGEMSFRFYDPVDSWTTGADGISERSLESFRLREVSALTVPPAYPNTSASLSLEAARMLAEAEEELRAGKVLSAENLAALEAAYAHLGELLKRAKASDDAADGSNDRAGVDLLRRRLELRGRGR